MATKYGPRGLQVIGVTKRTGTVVPKTGKTVNTPKYEDELAGLQQYHKDFELKWPLLLDEADKNNINYGEMGVPMTVIVDKKGVIRHIAQGYRPEGDTPFIEALLKEK